MAPPASAPPALQEAARNSTVVWQDDLKSLFTHAKDRFPDVVWELINDEDDNAKGVEEVWGHKGQLYATFEVTSRPSAGRCIVAGSVFQFHSLEVQPADATFSPEESVFIRYVICSWGSLLPCPHELG